MQAIAGHLTGGLQAARRVSAVSRKVWVSYWTWITGLLDPVGAACGTALVGLSVLFLMFSLIG
jgi:hypothetical protein